MPYLFFLGPVPLPITPSALSIKTPSLNRTVTLVNEGEINIPKGAGLREISFEFLLPRVQKYPFANYHIPYYTATVMTKLLVAWKNTMMPFRFIVARTSPKLLPLDYEYIKCLVEEFTFDEDAEAHGLDVMCSITLKEYRDYGTKILEKDPKSNTAKTTTNRPTDNKEVKSSVKAKSGDTLPNIAKKETGSFANTNAIAKANNYSVPDISTQLDQTLSDTFKDIGAFQPQDGSSILDGMLDPYETAEAAVKYDDYIASGGQYKDAIEMLRGNGVNGFLDPPTSGAIKIPVTKVKVTPDGFGTTVHKYTVNPL